MRFSAIVSLSATALLVAGVTACTGTDDAGINGGGGSGGEDAGLTGDDSGDAVDSGSTRDGGVHKDGGSHGDGGTNNDGGSSNDGGTIGNDASSTSYPAPHPPMPQLVSSGGPVIAHPKITTITFPGDALATQLESFASGIGATSYWSAATAEYGVSAATIGAPVHLTESAPSSIDDSAIQTWLADKLDGTHPEFGTPNASSLYAIYYPATTTVTLQGMTSCQAFGGYHNSVNVGGQEIAYAIMPRCSWGGQTELDTTTGTATHEFVEAVTDPHPLTNDPTYAGVDDDHVVWEMILLGEAGDLCAQFQDSFYKPSGFDYLVQRTWSNVAAAAGHDPCAPGLAGAYFNAAPVLNDAVSFNWQGQTGTTKGVRIPVGQSKTIEVDLYSDAPTSAWSVTADDLQTGNLTFAFNKATGNNGEKLQLTITVVSQNSQYGGEPFVIMSTKGSVRHYWFGFVGN